MWQEFADGHGTRSSTAEWKKKLCAIACKQQNCLVIRKQGAGEHLVRLKANKRESWVHNGTSTLRLSLPYMARQDDAETPRS